MAKVFKLDFNGFGRNVMRAGFMVDAMREVATDIQARAGDGYAINAEPGRLIALAMVYTDTPDAMRDNVKNNTLEKALRK